jgi:hypothetical protein
VNYTLTELTKQIHGGKICALLPPSSSGPGRGPLKAKTGVRVPLGAQKSDKTSQKTLDVEDILAGLRFENRNKLEGYRLTFRDSALKKNTIDIA